MMNCYFTSTIATLDRTIDRHFPIAFVVIQNSDGWEQTDQHSTSSIGNKQQGLKTNMADKTRCDGPSKPSFRDVVLAWLDPHGTHTRNEKTEKTHLLSYSVVLRTLM